jgi:hypothetical protein
MGRVPWWFKKLYEAELAETQNRRKSDPDFRRVPVNGMDSPYPLYEGENLTVDQKLKKYGIVQEPGDEAKSLVVAMSMVNPQVPPKLGHFLRDPENPGEQPVEDFGA